MRLVPRLAALAVATAAAFASIASAAPTTRPVSWTVGETTFDGVLVYDDANAAPRPGDSLANAR